MVRLGTYIYQYKKELTNLFCVVLIILKRNVYFKVIHNLLKTLRNLESCHQQLYDSYLIN